MAKLIASPDDLGEADIRLPRGTRLPRRVRRRLPGGLVLRTATEADIEPLADFNARVHGDELHRAGTWDELGGGHPTLTLRHQLLVEDPATGAIVSAAYLLPMRWRLGSVELAVGQIEAVGTDHAYRRRGLSRTIIEGLHAMSLAQGQLLTGIVGVRYLYRRFGYEYAVTFDGYRDQPRAAVGRVPRSSPRVRLARVEDAEPLSGLRRGWTDGLDLVQVVDPARFRFDIAGHVPGAFMDVDLSVAVDDDDRPIAYARAPTGPDGGWASVTEVVLGPPCRGRERAVVRALAASVLRTVDDATPTATTGGSATSDILTFDALAASDAVAASGGDSPPDPVAGIRWWLGAEHPVYEALAADLGPLDPPYAWYIRVPDAARFLQALVPVLDARLAASRFVDHDGTLTIDRSVETLRLDFVNGHVTAVAASPPRETDGARGDVAIPPLLLAQLVLGYRTIDELRAVYPDVWRGDRSAELLAVLFPKLRTWLPVFG